MPSSEGTKALQLGQSETAEAETFKSEKKLHVTFNVGGKHFSAFKCTLRSSGYFSSRLGEEFEPVDEVHSSENLT